MRRKVCIVVASRANYARIKTVMAAVREHPGTELQLVVAASALLERFGHAIDVIRRDGFTPSATAYIVVEGENPTTMAKSTGLAIVELATIFENLKPDVVLTVADRHETMATAVAASYMNIPLAHTQGGEVSGSIDESVRHAITKLAHIHFPATELSRERLIRMGEEPSRVHVTGCPSMDLALHAAREADAVLRAYQGHPPITFDTREPFLLVAQHPVTTEYAEAVGQIQATLDAIEELAMPTVMLYPNVDAGSDLIMKGIRVRRAEQWPHVTFAKNFPPEVYAALLARCAAVIGNSSSGIREAALLGVPAVNVGSRQRDRERGVNVVDAPHDRRAIADAVRRQIAHGPYPPDHRFGRGDAGQRIAEILARADVTIVKRMTY